MFALGWEEGGIMGTCLTYPPKENTISLKPQRIYANVPPYSNVNLEVKDPWSHGNFYQVLIRTWHKSHLAGIIARGKCLFSPSECWFVIVTCRSSYWV